MPRQPATLWHQYYQKAKDRDFGFYDNRPMEDYALDRYLDYGKLMNVLSEAEKAPKIVLTQSLVDAMNPALVGDSIHAMVEAGVLRLPYKKMLVELDCWIVDGNERVFVLCEEGVWTDVEHVNKPHEFNFRATMFSLYRSNGESAVVHPFETYVRFSPYTMEEGPILTIAAPPASFVQPDVSAEIPHLIAAAAEVESKIAMRALALSFIVTNTQGVAKEVVEVKPGLNKARLAKGRTPIPRHTVLRIGHVYSKTGEKVAYDGDRPDGRSMKVYMRRGHTRNQRYGKNWELSRLIYIEPVLVNYRGDGDMPSPTTVVRW